MQLQNNTNTKWLLKHFCSAEQTDTHGYRRGSKGVVCKSPPPSVLSQNEVFKTEQITASRARRRAMSPFGQILNPPPERRNIAAILVFDWIPRVLYNVILKIPGVCVECIPNRLTHKQL